MSRYRWIEYIVNIFQYFSYKILIEREKREMVSLDSTWNFIFRYFKKRKREYIERKIYSK